MSTTRIAVASMLVCMLSACATSHYSEMILYQRSDSESDYTLPKEESIYLANNPVFVVDGAKFSVEIKQINPGWLHQGGGFQIAGSDAEKLTKGQVEHLNGKELWLVSRITALAPNSPLELEGKQYFKVSNVKLGTQSFRSMPLDLSEGRLFTHAADSTYRVNIRVYEVDAFELKRALIKVQRENPGIVGLFTSAWRTITSTVGALAGDSAVSFAKATLRTDNLADPLLLESLLLQTKATIELSGTFHIYRRAGQLEADGHQSHEILLYDAWKSNSTWAAALQSKDGSLDKYKAAQAVTELAIKGDELTLDKSFIRLTISESVDDGTSKSAVDPDSAEDLRSVHQALPVD